MGLLSCFLLKIIRKLTVFLCCNWQSNRKMQNKDRQRERETRRAVRCLHLSWRPIRRLAGCESPAVGRRFHDWKTRRTHMSVLWHSPVRLSLQSPHESSFYRKQVPGVGVQLCVSRCGLFSDAIPRQPLNSEISQKMGFVAT